MMTDWRTSSYSFSNGACVQVGWRKSLYSMNHGACVEAASYRKASRSNSQGACVEAGHGPGVTGVRDSQLGEASPVLEFGPAAWAAFTSSLK